MIPAELYQPIYLYLILVLTIISCYRTNTITFRDISEENKNIIPALLLCLGLAIFIGGRPISGRYFGDTSNYAWMFQVLKNGDTYVIPEENGEWIWLQFMYWSAQTMDVSQFFTIVDLCYFGFTLWACRRFASNEVWIMVLFNLAALSFFSYGTNGIRNGMACSLTMVALSFMTSQKRDLVIAFILAFIAINIHRSTSLPILMAFISCFFIKSFKSAYTFWIASIFISLVAGGTITSIFAGLGFDNRASYLQTEMDEETFQHTGFRFDFLLYSMMPIVLGYYIIIRRGIRNKTYEFLLNTYTLSNAFWVMVIRANYSNRFAYLSWFLYPIVLAYPLLKMDVWDDQQGKRLSQIMLAQVGFTWFMETFYW